MRWCSSSAEIRTLPGRASGTRSVEGSGPTDGRGYPRVAPSTGPGTRRRRCWWRSTRTPGATSHARRSPRATARTRSTAAPSGGCSPASQRRTARRASATGAAARARGVGGVEVGRERVHEVGLVAEHLGLAGEDRDDVALGDGVEQGEELVAHPVAAEGGRLVGRILDRSQAEVPAERPGLAPAQAEQRPADGPHAGQPVEPGAAQEVEQHGLGLVVGCVAGQDVGRQRGVAGGPGAGLQVRPRRDLDPHGAEGRAEALGRVRHDVGLIVAAGAQPVVDVDRRHSRARGDGQDQQRQRVGAARHRAGDLGAGGREPAAGQERVDGRGRAPDRGHGRPGPVRRPRRPDRPGRPSAGAPGSPPGTAAAPDPPSRRRRRAGRRPARCGR